MREVTRVIVECGDKNIPATEVGSLPISCDSNYFNSYSHFAIHHEMLNVSTISLRCACIFQQFLSGQSQNRNVQRRSVKKRGIYSRKNSFGCWLWNRYTFHVCRKSWGFKGLRSRSVRHSLQSNGDCQVA